MIKLVPQFPRFALEHGSNGFNGGGGSGAIRWSFEKRQGELLINDADIEVNDAGAGHVYPYSFNREPEEQLLGRNTRQGSDLPETQRPRDVPIVMQLALEFGIAGLFQVHLEPALVVDFEVDYALGQQAHRKSVGPQHVVDGTLRRIGARGE